MLQIVLQGQRTATPAHLVKGEGPSTTALLPKVLLSICFRFRLEHAHTLSSQSLVWTFPKWQTPQSAALSLSVVAVISYRAGLVSWSFSLICIFMIFQLTFHTFRSSLVGQNAHLSALWMCCLPCNDSEHTSPQHGLNVKTEIRCFMQNERKKKKKAHGTVGLHLRGNLKKKIKS